MGSNGSSASAELEDFLNKPATQPPANITPNYDDPPNENEIAVVVISICIGLSCIFCFLRVYTRVFLVRRVKVEDYLGLLGFIFFVAGTWNLAGISNDIGFFVHLWNLRMKSVPGFIHGYIITTILWCIAFLLIKGAIILEWTHIFIRESVRNKFYWTCWVMIGANSFLYAAMVIGMNLSCNPRERIWQRWVPGTCINISAFNISCTVIILVANLIMVVLPHRVIWKLSMSNQQKIGVSFVFSVGIFACACAAGRVVSAVDMSLNADTTYAYSRYLMWGLAEATSTLLIFCVPAIPIAFRRGRPKRRFTSKMPIVSSQRSRSSKTRLHSWPRPSYEYRVMSDVSDVQLTGLENGKSLVGNETTEAEDNPLFSYLGIVKTTEIEVSVQKDADPRTSRHRQNERQHPWMYSQRASRQRIG